MRIYFAGAILGGRDLQPTYHQVIQALEADGHEVLTAHVGSADFEETQSDADIYERDMKWLESCNVMIADVTVPSLGVGFEIATAVHRDIPVAALVWYDPKKKVPKVSAMINGCPNVWVRIYLTAAQAVNEARLFVNMTGIEDDVVIRPGDVRVDNLIPTRFLRVVERRTDVDESDGTEWWETNLGGIEKTRIGRLVAREDVADWKWAQ